MGATRLVQVRLPVELAIKLRVLAATLDRPVNDILRKLVDDFVTEYSGSLGIQRMARIDEKDIPTIMAAIEGGVGKKLYRTKTGRLRQKGVASKPSQKKESG